jgi:predicted RNA-binding protein with RPS1 domain
VEFNGGQQGLLHISELSHQPVFLLKFCNRGIEVEQGLCSIF